MTNPQNLVTQYKQKLKDYTLDEGTSKFDTVQIKYDGFWTLLDIEDGALRVISSGGEVREVVQVPDILNGTRIISEWMFGTTWGKKFKEETSKDFLMFDLVRYKYADITHKPYFSRRNLLQHVNVLLPKNFVVINCFPPHSTEDLLAGDIEGVIFRNRSDSFGAQVGRYKKKFTMDYVYMGYNPGEGKYNGTVGSIKGGLYINNILQQVCNVGGLTDAQREEFKRGVYPLGTVFEVTGKALFSSGALRHPNFLRIRVDKQARECIK